MKNEELVKGNVITIYVDPITKQKPEGKAKLLKEVYKGRWEVKFISDDFVCERFV